MYHCHLRRISLLWHQMLFARDYRLAATPPRWPGPEGVASNQQDEANSPPGFWRAIRRARPWSSPPGPPPGSWSESAWSRTPCDTAGSWRGPGFPSSSGRCRLCRSGACRPAWRAPGRGRSRWRRSGLLSGCLGRTWQRPWSSVTNAALVVQNWERQADEEVRSGSGTRTAKVTCYSSPRLSYDPSFPHQTTRLSPLIYRIKKTTTTPSYPEQTIQAAAVPTLCACSDCARGERSADTSKDCG